MEKFELVNPNGMFVVETIEANTFTEAFKIFRKNYSGKWLLFRGEYESAKVNLDAKYQRNFKFKDEILETWEKV